MQYNASKKVLIATSTFGVYDCSPLDRLRESNFKVIENSYKRKLTKKEVVELLADDVIGIIAGLEPLDREVLENTNLRVISRCGSGLSNIDLKVAKKMGIKVCFTPYGPTTAVAELTIGAMISLLRGIPQMNNQMHEGRWVKKTGRQLEEKTVAIVGFGRIGRKVAALLRPFGVRLIVVDPNLSGDAEGVEVRSLVEAFTEADIITIHSSGEGQIIGENEFKCIKDGAFLLNVARGGLISEKFLIQALESGKISGVWLDTFGSEPYEGPLTKYPQAILTPHVGSYTVECRKSMEMDAVNNLILAFKELKYI